MKNSRTLFHIASDQEIKDGKTTDVYFARTKQILDARKLSQKKVVAEVTAGGFPRGWPWAVLCGVEEAARLLEGLKVDVHSMSEGSVVFSHDHYGVRVPVMTVAGSYGEFCVYETPLLGLVCQSSGVATVAARIRRTVGNKLLISFGIRRMHPALSPMIDRASYIGGFDGVSSLTGAEAIGKKPSGTMPHALIVMFGDQVKAWKAFDELMPKDVPRIALADTYFDEKAEAIMAAEALSDRLYGVRLDTPGSRKGSFPEIIREIRWELDVRGFRNVKIIVSGGVDDKNVQRLSEAGVDGFGVGTSVSNAPTIDFALDIVEVEKKLSAKRGKLSGMKQVWRCPQCLVDVVRPTAEEKPTCPRCRGKTEPMLKPLIIGGKLDFQLPSVDEIRSYVLRQIQKLPEDSR